MKVGIKYCGGCNPRYDRKKWVHQLVDALDTSIVFEHASEASSYDVLLCVGGCTNCCIDDSPYSKQEVIRIKSASDNAKVIADLTSKHKTKR